MYRNPGSVDKNGTLQLHYLGVPLNVRVKAIKQPNWNLYTTAGTMVEKGPAHIILKKWIVDRLST